MKPTIGNRTMLCRASWTLLIGFGVGLGLCSTAWPAPKVQIIIPDSAPKMEQFAAREMAAMIGRLFEAEVELQTEPSATRESTEQPVHTILIGSPKTNPAIANLPGIRWPELSNQGLALLSTNDPKRPTLAVGGGSPAATLWAVYEAGHRWGIRYLLSGDVYPATSPAWSLSDWNVVREPTLATRAWRTVNDFAIGPEAWGLEEQRRVLRQLAKLKFNRVVISVYPWQPFVDFEFRGVRKNSALLWYGYRYPIDAETAGRIPFRGATEFTNPDFVGKTGYQERIDAGVGLVRGIIDEAQSLGMTTALSLSPLEFPKEFAPVLPEAKQITSLENLVIGPGPKQPPDDPLLLDLTKTQLAAYLRTYPDLDALYLSLPEFPDWVEHFEASWTRIQKRSRLGDATTLEQLTNAARDRKLVASGDRGVQALRGNLAAIDFLQTLLADKQTFRRPDGKPVEINITQVDTALFPVLDKLGMPDAGWMHFVDYTARRVVQNTDLLRRLPASARSSRHALILTLADDNVGVLPQMSTPHLHRLIGQMREQGFHGFSTRYWLIGDLDHTVLYLSRAGFDTQATPDTVLQELIDPMCGEGVRDRVAIAFRKIEQATDRIDEQDIGFTFPVPQVVMRHYAADSDPPAWWAEVQKLYGEAMNEMYRAHDRSHPRGRPFLRYFAKRLEFTSSYLDSIQALRRAAAARAKGDRELQVQQVEKAVEAMYNGLNAISEVARDSGDLGVIAVLNEYGYRPLRKELERLDSEP